MSGKADKKKPLVPRLRFPEFRDAGPWEVKRVGYFLTESRIDGSTGDIAKKLTVKLWGGGVVSKNEYLPGSPNTKYYRRKAGQFIYSKLDFLNGAFGIIPYELDGYESTLDLPSFDFTKDIVPRFFLEYVRRPQFYKKHGEQADGSRKAKRIQVDYFLDLYVAVPCLAEQQRIADCLSSLDELIELEAKKLEALQAHKKGLMQQLFPREGETTPRLRFSEFRDAGPWEVKRLGELYRFIPTNSFSREQLTYESGTIKNIHYGDIHTKYRALFDVEREHVPFLIGNGVNEDFDDERFCVPGDVIFADASEDLDDIGKAIEIVNIGSHKVVAGLHTLHARQLAEDLVIGFGGYLFQCNAIREQIRKQAQGAKVLGISATRLKSIKLFAPRKPEQQKIADCLSSLDELIELEAKKLEALKTHKKGLMQQLFPNYDL